MSKMVQTIEFKNLKIHSNFDRSKKDLPVLENFQIKYGFEWFE
jgi:hypothetical protein